MKTLLADIGNSAIKVGRLFRSIAQIADTSPAWSFVLQELDSDPFEDEPAQWYCVSVNGPGLAQLIQWIEAHRPADNVRILTYRDFEMPLKVEAPQRLGIDRLAAAASAARLKHPSAAAIVVDIGTATTVDAVSPDGKFLGGAILASPELMLRALNTKTQALPIVDWRDGPVPPDPIGRHTEAALRSGAFWGQVGAIQGLIQQYRSVLGEQVEVLICGGGSLAIAPLLVPPARCCPGLVLAGIATTVELESER